MLFWIIVAVLTAAVAAFLLKPLLRPGREADAGRAGEAEVYKDQLKEVDRDLAEGLIGAEEAEYARAEIGRRLIAASAGRSASARAMSAARLRQAAAVAVVVVLPATGLCLYLLTGSPGTPDQPLAARLENPGNNIELLVAKAERHLAENPTDGKGWDILAPIYFRAGRLGDAELAYRNAIRYLGVSAERVTGLGETLVASNRGVITDDANAAFREAVRRDPENPRARFYLALALEQAGRRDEARAAFEALQKETPADAPWQPLLREHIARNGGGAPAPAPPGGPTDADVEAAAGMDAGDRQEMIRGMVESLDARLKEEPGNFEGWMRLVRSYAVLGEKDKAVAALREALSAFPADGSEGQQLVAMARAAGLDVEGALK
ncbi:c-type cytochrome biogenesis protein CcmI [Rhizobiaceae bacterium BDR2-2]|uniref:C-type cytochrome biogenesis protein CcmI n=1 Tax=Ectorhizobium quercum TaxID=2965071 RepID=A0AAE3N0P5_9HYPH|nr:c-type cytochrome biogenesis protein CcmI [Ectorhizobium quercum]MCX8998449.1 c-type cytochrome biogenesis protein CcmI [Ectorhizobium quercum]